MDNYILPNRGNPSETSLLSYLRKSIEAFSDITGIPVTFFDDSSELSWTNNENVKICNLFNAYSDSGSTCRKGLLSACKFSSSLGEPYIFLCRSGLTNIAVSIIVNGETLGCIIAGPIVMGQIRNSTVSKFTFNNSLTTSEENIARMFANTMPVFEPKQISKLALLLYNSITASININSDYESLRKTTNDKMSISNKIRIMQKSSDLESIPDLENELVQTVITGQTEDALKKFAEYYDKLFIIESGDLQSIKAKVLWLFAIITRVATERHSRINDIIDSELDIIVKLIDVENHKQLKDVSNNLLVTISSNLLTSVYDGKSKIIANAVKYVNNNYSIRITLTDIEKNLHVNPSYFSSLFKHEMGISFIGYINQVKINYACHLLIESSLTIIDIALDLGFDDQSYFTKVFKKQCGITPKDYRVINGSLKGGQ
ncbi:MAG: helix-turn-helix domain-containing protein [Peptostreptococcaceae bacterium]|nr:helix-turn-helix domain-containing protein [Peptostreptococcaceae bacterium]